MVTLLLSHPNQEAEINLKLNVINTDCSEFDEDAKLEVLRADDFNNDEIEIIVYPVKIKDDADVENSIQDFLNDVDDGEINIHIDIKNGIYIEDSDGGILRETEFKKGFMYKDCIINEIILKLRKML